MRCKSQLIFVLGGASSGKSEAALRLATKGVRPTVSRAFVATGQALDKEMAERIARHRSSRPASWVTAEVPLDLTGWIERHGREHRVIVVDCLTMWLSNQFGQGRVDAGIVQDMQGVLGAARRTRARIVLVANELGMGIVPGDAVSRRFREVAGTINQLIADESDETHLVVSGLSVRLK
ncbi:bifunctional adenosylcobinamide kinase/adenosylcobinamide-phosphate guanylyltransferase [Nitrospira japonica]|uniref:bifunctional adenosylcobinamide kinase/adenosylcobinamide-phosphate guanylyltransferase n=1 Tax=Nitrospira japonica TaxID=1325564 RepID=UPI0018D2FAB1|nr:bifunctional adenosylcobinamide kinase/adenosylcobinamide-phosphate guanylyltransferase [Nitrospira japonica]